MRTSYLKWAGSKWQLAKILLRKFPSKFNRYIEPFCGSAAMFFAYYDGSFCSIFDEERPLALLNDSNVLLINCHKQVRDEPKALMEILDLLIDEYKQNPEEVYLAKRKLLNIEKDPVKSAALFIFVNKTSFNGLYRVNSKGEFNVPWNQVANQSFYHRGSLLRCSKLLSCYAALSAKDYKEFLEESCVKGDFVFIDSPYEFISDTSNFTGYTKDSWSREDTINLAIELEKLHMRKIKFLMTNSDSPFVYNLFSNWKIEKTLAHRFVKAINGENETREKVWETIITNY